MRFISLPGIQIGKSDSRSKDKSFLEPKAYVSMVF